MDESRDGLGAVHDRQHRGQDKCGEDSGIDDKAPRRLMGEIFIADFEESGVMENLDKLDQLRERFKEYNGFST